MAQPLRFSFSWSISIIHDGVSRHHSQLLETEEDFSSISCSILFKIHGSSLMPSFHNCFDCENSFHPSGAFHELFSISLLWRPFYKYYSFQLSARIFQILLVHHSSILLSARDRFVLMYLNPLKYLRSFSNSFRWFVPLLLSFSILTVVHSRFLRE